jgi:hypothetical protein
MKQAVPQSWDTLHSIFNIDKVGDIKISFVEYSASKKVCLQPDIVEYNPRGQLSMYDLIINKQTMAHFGMAFDFKEKVIPLFEGTLCDWKLPSVSFELRNKTISWHALPYPAQEAYSHPHKRN